MQAVLLTLLLASAAPEFEAQPLEGAAVAGTLVELDARHVVLQTSGGRVSLELEKLMGLAPRNKPAPGKQEPGVWVELTDGSLLVASQYTAQEGKAQVALLDGQTLDLPTSRVAAVRFQSGPAAAAGEWSRILNLKSPNDVLVTVKGETVDYHKGAIREVTDKLVQFELDGEPLGVKRPKVYGLIYYHAAENAASPAAMRIVDAGGSRWAVRTVEQASSKLQWTTPSGLTISRPLEQVAQIDLAGGKILYLSDLEPESSTYTPYFALEKELPARLEFFRPRQDRNLESRPLRIGGQPFSKGLAMHSRTELVYYLPGPFGRFLAVAGIDDDVHPRGAVRLVVRGDDKVLLDTVVSGADRPKPIEVDLAGVRRLIILADFTGESDVAGHLDLGNARVIK